MIEADKGVFVAECLVSDHHSDVRLLLLGERGPAFLSLVDHEIEFCAPTTHMVTLHRCAWCEKQCISCDLIESRNYDPTVSIS